MNNDKRTNNLDKEKISMTDLYINQNKGWRFKWTKEEDDILREYYHSGGYEKVLELLPNRNKQGIQSRASKLGIKYLTYNKEYFLNIDSPNKAYWLGFLYADGYTTSNSRWGLELQYQDKYHMEHLLSEIEFSGLSKERIRDGNKSCSFLIKNKIMTDSLIKLGVVPNKTEILKFPSEETLCKEYYADFIRGFFDGDGCISYNYITKPRKDRGNKIYTRLRKEINIVCKSDKFTKSILDILNSNDIHMNLNINKSHNNLNVIKTSCMDDIKKFYDFIYKNSTELNRLSRKHDKFLSLFEGRCA